MQTQEYATIYETIVTKIIQTPDPNGCQYALPRYQNPRYQNPFKFMPSDYSPELLKKMEDSNMWGNIFGHVSQETLTARLILNKIAKNRTPLFSSNRIYRIKQFIAELDSGFMSPKIRNELIAHFCKFKQTYWAFTKLAKIWKIRKTPVRIQTDLYMNELDPTHPSTFQLVHTNGIYLFSLQNLARIIVDAITNQSGMFLEPLHIKNPYTNNVLSKSDLFNIYFAMHHNHIRIHELFEKFFKCEFNIYEFRRKHETELRDFAIEQYSKTASTSELAQDVSDMLMLHKMTNQIRVAHGYPQSELVKTMRPFLKLYLLERYSFSSMTRKYAGRQVNLELRQFSEKNPDYGMRIPMHSPTNFNPFSQNNQSITRQTAFVTTTKQYKTYCESRYLTTHVYDDTTFENYVEMGDSLKTYDGPDEDEGVPIPSPSPVAYQEQSYQNERIQEHALAILSRLGRAPNAISARNINTHSPSPVIINQILNNYISNVSPPQEQEQEDEEVINNPPYEQDDSDMDLDNEYDDEDGEDSVS